jgi:type IX secretion system PorP/SprF family membrane protein
MKRNYIFNLLILVFSCFALPAQDVHFSQMTETPLYLSPANTGFFNGYVRAIANYRSQWSSMNKAFQTEAISIDGGLFRSKKHQAFMGIGLTLFRDQAGVAKVSTTNLLLNVSGLVKIGKRSALSAGLAFGTTGGNANYSSLTYASQFNGNILDPTTVSGETPYRQFTTLDVGTGLAYEYARYRRDTDHDDVMSFKVAFGAYHLNRPVQDFGAGSNYKLPIRLAYSITSVLDIQDTKFTLNPVAVFQSQGTAQELYFGSYIKYRMSSGTKVTGEKTQNAIGFGMFYRRKDAVIPGLIFDFGDLSFAMAYDVNISPYSTASKSFGGFEISLRYNKLASSLFDSKREFK